MGISGTAGDYGAPYRSCGCNTRCLHVRSGLRPDHGVDQIAAAETAGKLLVINAGAPDPYQLWTTTVLVRPIVGPHP